MSKIIITVVNYFGDEALIAFIEKELLSQQDISLTIAIVDNGSDKNLLQAYSEKYSNIVYLKPEVNLGYLGAAYFAYFNLIEKEKRSFNYFILSNFDLTLPHNHALSQLTERAKVNAFSVFGPQIINLPDKGTSNPMYADRLHISHIKRLLFVNSNHLISLGYQFLHRLKKKQSSASMPTSQACYAIHGSMMCFDAAFFEKGGTLNYPSFLYGEEIFIAEQCLENKISLGFISEVVVEHHEHATTGKWKSRLHMQFLHDSLSWLKNQYFTK